MSKAKKRGIEFFLLSVLVDLVGYFSYAFPGGGEITDAVWGPLQAAYIWWAYKTPTFAVIGFVEEILPGTDFIPTATFAHLVTQGGFK